ncbi:conjugal transfer protein TraG N-terminal domain-containing protein [Cronobacter sakazakii]|nr:conjugal transfer protein TraG N-terminal domain-containing protein [Cronobacter sakazakii]
MKKYPLFLLGLAVVSPSAFALDAEYVVMGGFTTVVNAFTRIKFNFNDNAYETLVAAFVVMGLIAALLIKSAKGGIEFLETGKGQMGVGWLAMTLIGTMFYFGLVQHKGTIHIYDQSRNQYQAVSGIPDFLIVTASVTNQVYQAFVDMSNRNTATTTRFTGEGTPIKMLLGVLNRNGAQYDPYLTDNIRTMWNQCAPVAQTRGFDPRILKTGASVLDVVTALTPLRNQAVYTQWYSPSNPAGATITCDQAYLALKSDLGNPAAYSARLQDICTKNGYKVSDAAQLADCKGRMEEGFQTIFGSSVLSLNTAMSNIVVSQAIADAMMQNNPDVASSLMTNRAMINGGMADAVTNPEWLSVIMSGVIAIILSVTPILLLLVFTPLMGKALTLLFGLWVFITTWQIADVMLLQAGTDEIITAMSDIKSMGLGIDAVQMGPSSAIKAMTVMASARETAVQIAMLVAGLFGVSAYGLSAFGQKAMGRLDRVTEEVSDKAWTPEGQGGQINAMRQGHANLQTAADIGSIEMMSNASSFRDSADVHAATSQIQALGGTNQAAQRTGAVEGGRATGTTRGYENGNIHGGFNAASETAMISTQSSVGDSQGHKQAADSQGMSVTEQSALSTGVNTTMQTADAQSNLKQSSGNLKSLAEQQRDLHSTERQTQIGSAGGIKQAAAATGKSVEEFTHEKTATSAVSEHASGQGQLQAAGGSLSGLHQRSAFSAAAESDERQGHSQALHNAYDGNGGIAQGVSESQTESMTQNLHDMREQKANVEEISKATGTSESEARTLLAESRSAEQMGVLQGNDYNTRQMQENSAWSTQKGASVIQGEKSAYQERGVAMPEQAKRHGEIETHKTLSEQDKFNSLSGAIGSDKSTADAFAGANTTIAVTKPEAEQLLNNNLLQPTQAEAIPENGVGAVHMSMRESSDGKNMASASVQTGNSTSVDNSFSANEGQNFGSAISAQQNLQKAPNIERIIDASERTNPGSSSRVVGSEIANSLSPFIHQTGDDRTQETLDGGISVGRTGLMRKLGNALGVQLQAGASMTDVNGRSTAVDQIAAAATQRVEQFRNSANEQADEAKLTGSAREQFVNQQVAMQTEALYKQLLKTAEETASAQSNGSIVSQVSLMEKNAATASTPQQENGFVRKGASSPGEYMEMQQRKNETGSEQPQTVNAGNRIGSAGIVSEASSAKQAEKETLSLTSPTNNTGRMMAAENDKPISQPGNLPEAKILSPRQSTTVDEPAVQTIQPSLNNTNQTESATIITQPSDSPVDQQEQRGAQYAANQPVPNQPTLSGGNNFFSTENKNSVSQPDKAGEHQEEQHQTAHPPVSSSGNERGIPLENIAGKKDRNIPG